MPAFAGQARLDEFDVTDSSETGFDRPITFTLPHEDARGRVVRLGPVLDTILSAHAYPPVAERVLAEALVLTALLGSTLKEAGDQLTLQAQTEKGAISLLVCDYIAGKLRGHLSFDPERLAEAGADPTLFGLFGKGFLALTANRHSGRDAARCGRRLYRRRCVGAEPCGR